MTLWSLANGSHTPFSVDQIAVDAGDQGFSQKFWWGDLLSGTILFSVPDGDRVRWGILPSGMESDEENLEKLSAEAKNVPPTAKLEQILVF